MDYIFLIIALFVIVVLIALVLILNKTKVNVIGGPGGILVTSGGCSVNAGALPNLSFNPCCTIFGTATNTRYLSSLNLVVSPNPISYVDVCSGFCVGGYNKTTGACVDLGPNIDSGQNNFDICASASKPVGCNDLSLPVATAGTLLLYPYSAGTLLCQSSTPCSISG